MVTPDVFRHLAENAPDMLYRYQIHPSPGFRYVSPASLSLTGLPPDAFYEEPQAMHRLTHPADREELARALSADACRGQRVTIRFQRTDGSLVWVEHRLAPVHDEAGVVVAVDGIAREIANRVAPSGEAEIREAVAARARATAELERHNQQLQALFLYMAEGVVAVDGAGLLLMVNPAATSLLGQPGPFWGLPLTSAGLPDSLVRAMLGSDAGGKPGMVESRFPCGGLEIRALVSPMLGESGEHLGTVALLQDVTSEDRMKRLRENFVANVSHELRGPLAALSAGVEAMHDGLIPHESRPRYLKAMLAEIGRLRRLTDSLLELSRIDAGMIQIPIEEFDLAPLAESLVETWGPRAASAGISLLKDCPHLRVMGSIDRVEEVLTNFLDNAVRHTQAGGRITLFARTEGEMVRVGVEDTGSGIEAVHLPHLWDRFYKTDPARTRTPERGTGLGLSICRQLVELMGGEVAVTSRPGVGSRFSFTLVAGGQ